jgi:hypothetical protein
MEHDEALVEFASSTWNIFSLYINLLQMFLGKITTVFLKDDASHHENGCCAEK